MALESAFCCCKPLRRACLILLYFDLVIYALAVFFDISLLTNGLSFHIYAIYSNPLINFINELIGCVIFSVTIIIIYQNKPAQCWLTIVIVYLLIQSVINVNIIITMKADAANNDHVISLERLMFLISIMFELYLALACFCYMEELKRPVQLIPLGQTTIVSVPNVQFPTAPYPPQTHQYVGLPPQYAIQLAQNPNVPPECHTQPAQNPDFPPSYSTLFAAP